MSFSSEAYYDGSDADYVRAALVPRWRPTESIEVVPFWSLSRGRDEETPPVIRTAGSFLPPRVERRRYFGQPWADNETESINYGVIAKARIGDHWALAGGVFRSIYDKPSGYTDLYVGTTEDGLTRELVIADPQQRYASTSGEARMSRSFSEGPRLHVLHAAVRARRLESEYGGSAAGVGLGHTPVG